MTWDASTPDDDTYAANQIHLQIQSDKEMIRERLEASDGTIKAHYASDSDDSGKHQPSLVGFALIHATYAALVAYTPKVPGSLHAVTSPLGLYTVDEAGTLLAVFPATHQTYSGRDDDDHSLYQTESVSKTMDGDLAFTGSLTLTTGVVDADHLPSTHGDEHWTEAHGANTLGERHIKDGELAEEWLVHGVTTGTGYVTVSTNGSHSWPFVVNGTSAQSGQVFWRMRLTYDGKLGFYSTTYGWLDNDVSVGRYQETL